MKNIRIRLFAGAVGFLLGLQGPVTATAGTKEKVLHAFGERGGYYPSGSLTDGKGMLYGTTGAGGANCKFAIYESCGVVFALDPKTAALTTVYSFCSAKNCTDGQGPDGVLIDVQNTLYGTTIAGGTYTMSCSRGDTAGCGTVFAVDTSTGAEQVVYSFCSQRDCSDGEYPVGGVTDLNGTLYGTTSQGGSHQGGTAFALDPKTATETVLHAFGNGIDGFGPGAGLIDVKGTLYGTTQSGGTFGHGTIFALDPDTGVETVLYSFCSRSNCTDGANPGASLIVVNNLLYGTTPEGGTGNSGCDAGCGTVFSLDPWTGAETVLYSFCGQDNCTDGAGPAGSLIDVDGTLYGTTAGGGTYGVGTVFALDPTTDGETVLHSFCPNYSCSDGNDPAGGLLDVKGTLYGTTRSGGPHVLGTVFAIRKP